MKSAFFIVTLKDRETEQRYSYAMHITSSVNMHSIVSAISEQAEIEWLSLAYGKQQAIETAKEWNQSWADKECLWMNAPICRAVFF